MQTRIFARLSVAVSLALALAYATLSAQTFTHNVTELAADQAAADTTISLVSVSAATGSSFGAVQAGQLVLVDGELETFVSVTGTSTIWNVQRRGARVLHKSGTNVYIGTPGSFQSSDPPPGGCVVASQPKFWINIGTPGAAFGSNSGRAYVCGSDSVWHLAQVPYVPGLYSGQTAGTTTVVLTSAQSGSTFLFDAASGNNYVLPAPQPGLTFDFIQTATVTSNNAEVQTNASTVFIAGLIHIFGTATTNDFTCNGTSHLALKMNGSTTGGVIGGHLKFTALTTTKWWVDGNNVQGSGTGATPCSTTT